MSEEILTPDQRAKLLARLVAGDTVGPALSSAIGGRLSAKAYKALRATRLVDAELHAACEAAERRANDDVPDKRRRSQPSDLPATEDPDPAVRAEVARVAVAVGEVPREVASDRPKVQADSGLSALAAQLQSVASPYREAPPDGTLAEQAARDAADYAIGDMGYVLLVDARCVKMGKPPMSGWWRYSVGGFLDSGKPWGVWDVGRGGGKSSTLEVVAAAISRYCKRKVPPGQTWTVPFISVGPDDANRRINGIAAAYRADGLAIVGDVDGDGEKVKPGEGVKISRAPRGSLALTDIHGNSIMLASVAGTIGNLSGPSTVFLLIDEAAKLHDKSTNANPLTEIIASASQTSRGRPGWRGIICSSSFDKTGVHYAMVNAGPNEVTFVADIGVQFIEDAVRGFESVAAWEQRRGDAVAARRIREHAATLTCASPWIPTWTAFPGFGNPALDEHGSPTGAAWDGAALATRMLVEVLPEKALEGIPRIDYWLRENGSVPLDKGGNVKGLSPWCDGLAERNQRLSALARGRNDGRTLDGGARERQPGDRRRPPSGRGRMIG